MAVHLVLMGVACTLQVCTLYPCNCAAAALPALCQPSETDGCAGLLVLRAIYLPSHRAATHAAACIHTHTHASLWPLCADPHGLVPCRLHLLRLRPLAAGALGGVSHRWAGGAQSIERAELGAT